MPTRYRGVRPFPLAVVETPWPSWRCCRIAPPPWLCPRWVTSFPDLKHEPLSLASLDHVVGFDPTAVLVDAVENPAQAWSVLQELRARDDRVPAMLIVERDQLERYPWHEVADEFVYPGAPEGELRVRLAMLRRRSGAGDGSVIRLGALALDTETYRVTANGRSLDLTFKEFELLRFLASSPGRVFTRPDAAARGLGLRLLWRHAHRGRARAAAPSQARTRTRAPDRDRAERGLPGGRPRLRSTVDARRPPTHGRSAAIARHLATDGAGAAGPNGPGPAT